MARDKTQKFRLDAEHSLARWETIQYVSVSHGRTKARERQCWHRKPDSLGRGGYGKVWLESLEGGHTVRAVKVCEIDSEVNKRELGALVEFTIRSVRGGEADLFVQLLGWWEDPIRRCLSIAMEYFPHGDLSLYISSATEDDSRQILKNVLRGVKAMHALNFTHRDIKPSNILVKHKPPDFPYWHVKLGDFGISKKTEEGSNTATFGQGTMSYAAPEVFPYNQNGIRGYTHKVDIWSVGCIMYDLAVGKSHSFMNETNRFQLDYCTGIRPLNLEQVENKLQPAGLELLRRMLDRSPEQRPEASAALQSQWFIEDNDSIPDDSSTDTDGLNVPESLPESTVPETLQDTNTTAGTDEEFRPIPDPEVEALKPSTPPARAPSPKVGDTEGLLQVLGSVWTKDEGWGRWPQQPKKQDTPTHIHTAGGVSAGEQVDKSIMSADSVGVSPLRLDGNDQEDFGDITEFLKSKGIDLPEHLAQQLRRDVVRRGEKPQNLLADSKEAKTLEQTKPLQEKTSSGEAKSAEDAESSRAAKSPLEVEPLQKAKSSEEALPLREPKGPKTTDGLTGDDVQLADTYMHGDKSVHQAAIKGDTRMLAYMRTRGHDLSLEDPDDFDYTPLQLAVRMGHIDTVDYLLKEGGQSIDIKTKKYGSSLIQIAALNGQLAMLDHLNDLGQDIHEDRSDGTTTIHFAAGSGSITLLELLRTFGQDVFAVNNDGETLVHWAASEGRREMVKHLRLQGLDVGAKDKNSYTPLHSAARNGYITLVEDLLELGLKVDVKDERGAAPIHYAALGGEIETVDFLLKLGQDLHVKDNNDSTLIHYAVWDGQIAMVDHLHKLGLALDEKNDSGTTPMHCAAQVGSTAMVDHLIELGQDISIRDDRGSRPMHTAAETGQKAMMEYLRSLGADVNVADDQGYTPMHRACWNGDRDIVDYLLDHGVSVGIRTGEGTTPMHYAAWNGQIAMVDYLKGLGQDIEVKEDDGYTPMLYAAKNGHKMMMDHLKVLGADITAKENEGFSTMHQAAWNGDRSIVDYLRYHGVSIAIRTNDGYTPMHYAAWNGQIEMVDHLQGLGQDIGVKSDNGNTPMSLADGNQKLEMVRHLKKLGQKVDEDAKKDDRPALKNRWKNFFSHSR